ncbi:hypothetical protein D3C81_1757330 [compost metagenome]
MQIGASLGCLRDVLYQQDHTLQLSIADCLAQLLRCDVALQDGIRKTGLVIQPDLVVMPFQHGDLHHTVLYVLRRDISPRHQITVLAVITGNTFCRRLQFTQAALGTRDILHQRQQQRAIYRLIAADAKRLHLEAYAIDR